MKSNSIDVDSMQMKLCEIASEEIYSPACTTTLTFPGKYDNACGDDKTNGFHDPCAHSVAVNSLIGRWPTVKRLPWIFRLMIVLRKSVENEEEEEAVCWEFLPINKDSLELFISWLDGHELCIFFDDPGIGLERGWEEGGLAQGRR
ncbi:hypothetical protein HZH68_012266 [Vespula germanica]|uniref:Uncharacterized protein n=1 Tax=Vespula germanica TaxID=30212 RepID=A0A834MYE3_VESGE|nr:hypothetical protein HZH68_012266 [Vespula germanica]